MSLSERMKSSQLNIFELGKSGMIGTWADEVAQLEAEKARLRKKIQEIADKIEYDSLVDDIHSQLLAVLK